ncbi:UNVERIFIED_CONTAM: hypothetical protein FKN15_070258 [Acipenser sinensis]
MERRELLILLLAGLFAPASSQIRKLLFVEAEKSWSEAQSYCRERYTDLVTVDSQDEAELLFIAEHSLNDAAWIGLYRDTQNWQWSNSDDVIYTNWRADLFCASVNSQGEWDDLVCSEKKAFMCFKETSNITERYTLIEELKTWTEAQQYCREHHTDLVSIKSASENEDLVKKAQGKPFWIGLFNNPWKWSRQSYNYIFHNWDNEEPNNVRGSEGGSEGCVVMDYSDGLCSFEEAEETWHDAQSYCRNQSKELVTIQYQARVNETLDLLNSTGSSDAWIGLYHDKENWQWSKGDAFIYYNWSTVQFCASVNSEGEWEDRACSETTRFMCDSETSNITARYTLIEELKTWTEAQQYCREHHTDLVSIKSASENADLVKKAQGKTFWIGLFNNPWKWSHQGDNYTFQNWANEQPNNVGGNEKCVIIGVRDGQYQSRDPGPSSPPSTPVSQDHMAIGRVKLTAPKGMNLEDPKVSEAILEQIREYFSKKFPMDGVNMRWRKQDGEIFHEDVEEEDEEKEEEEKCSDP